MLPAPGENLADRFLTAAERAPDRLALIVAGEDPVRLTYADLRARVARAAAALHERGVGPGDRVGVLLANGNEHLESMLGAFLLRAIPVNLGLRDTGDELRAVLDASDTRLVVQEPDLAPPGRAGLARGRDYEAALRAAGDPPVVTDRSGADEYILFTGGTTGRPKGVRWRHADLYLGALAAVGTPTAPDRAVRCLPASPFAHGTGQWMALTTLLRGGTVVCRRDRSFEPEAVLDTVDAESVSFLAIVGDAFALPIVEVLEACPGRWSLSSLTTVLSGGALLSAPVKRRLLALLPTLLVVDGFGASETGGHGRMISVAGAVPDGPPRFAIDEQTAVLDDDHRPLVPGDGRVGWLARRGPIPLGYLDDQASPVSFPVVDGVRWALSGDRATHDADGSIVVLGRGTSTISTGGHKVHAEEVEGCLRSHPAVRDAVVVGVPDERFGERVTAVVAPSPDAEPTLASVQDHCADRLAPYKLPRRLVLVDAVQRSPAGKPDYAWARRVAGA